MYNQCEMHITTCYKMIPGPDKCYDKNAQQRPTVPSHINNTVVGQTAAVRGDKRYSSKQSNCHIKVHYANVLHTQKAQMRSQEEIERLMKLHKKHLKHS